MFNTLKLKYNSIIEKKSKLKKFEKDYQYFLLNSLKTVTRRPLLEEDTPFTSYDGHYTFFTVWALEILNKTKPKLHFDIASTLNFVTAATVITKVKFYDIRPPQINMRNLTVHKGDITALPIRTSSIKSLSCLHVIEHIGLGRYGDAIDLEGDTKAAKELMRVLAPGGNLMVAVPMGKGKIEFNAHRIYNYQEIINMFSTLTLINFSYISEKVGVGFINRNPVEDSMTENYGCGCFWFKK